MTDRIIVALDKIATWSIFLMILCLPFGKSIVEITIVTALGSVVAGKLLKGERLITDHSWANFFLYCYLAASLLSIVNSSSLSLSVRAFFTKSLKFAALFLVVKEIINSREKLNGFTVIAMLSSLIVVTDAFIQHFITHVDLLHNYPSFKYQATQPFDQTFPTACFPFPNDFAAWMLIFIFPIGMHAFFSRGSVVSRGLTGFISACLIYLLVLTKVRGAWLGFLIALGSLSVFRLKRVFVIAVLVIVAGALFMNKEFIPEILSRASISDRNIMWKNGFEIFKEHPLIGNGVNTFFNKYKEIRDDEYRGIKGSYAHNCYLQMAADTGLFGLAAFLSFVAVLIGSGLLFMRRCREPFYRTLALGLTTGIIAFLLHSFVDTNLYSLNLAALFWLSCGFLTAVMAIARREEG